DVLGEIAGDGEADALEAARTALDRRVNADDLAVERHERTAAVARIDRRVGLDEVLVEIHVESGATLGADDAAGHRAGEPERRADGENAIADFRGGAVAQFQVREAGPLRIQRDHSEIGTLVAMDALRGELAAVLKRDGDAVGAFDDVI